jgi:hypothetical protein
MVLSDQAFRGGEVETGPMTIGAGDSAVPYAGLDTGLDTAPDTALAAASAAAPRARPGTEPGAGPCDARTAIPAAREDIAQEMRQDLPLRRSFQRSGTVAELIALVAPVEMPGAMANATVDAADCAVGAADWAVGAADMVAGAMNVAGATGALPREAL